MKRENCRRKRESKKGKVEKERSKGRRGGNKKEKVEKEASKGGKKEKIRDS